MSAARATGGHRIKRAIHINVATVRFLTDAEVHRLGNGAEAAEASPCVL